MKVNFEKRAKRVAEMRVKLREVHNKYCEEKDLESPEKIIDLFSYGKSKSEEVNEKMKPFRKIAVMLEGIEEANEDCSDEEFFIDFKNIEENFEESLEKLKN